LYDRAWPIHVDHALERVSPLGWWDFGAEADRVREGLGVSLRVLGWAIA